MKIKNNNKKSLKPLLIIAVIAFLIICGYTGIALKTGLWPFITLPSTSKSEPLSPDQDKTTTKTPVDTNASGATTPDQVPINKNISASITQLTEDSNNNILFSANIIGLDKPTAKGTCVITFTNDNDKPYIQQVDSTIKGGDTICGQLSISSLNFSYLGTWKVNLRFYLDNQQTTTDGTIDIH